jgi:hypothetical protein
MGSAISTFHFLLFLNRSQSSKEVNFYCDFSHRMAPAKKV